jgi:hypothetical protein
MLLVSLPGLVLVVAACAYRSADRSFPAIRAGLWLTMLGLAFLLDDRSAPVVDATPRAPWWWVSTRIMAVGPWVLVACLAPPYWAAAHGGAAVARPMTTAAGGFAAALIAVAAVGRRAGLLAAGEVACGIGALVVVGTAVMGVPRQLLPLFGGLDEIPRQIAPWCAVLASAAVVIATALGTRSGSPRWPTFPTR